MAPRGAARTASGEGTHPARAEAVRERYRATFGRVPEGIQTRLAVAEATGRMAAVEAVEQLRAELLAANPLGARTQQLVHFGQLLVLGREAPARLHAAAALRAGASAADLVGVAETALVTGGMPAYALGIDITAGLLPAGAGSGPAPAPAPG